MATPHTLSAEFHASIKDIGELSWDGCAGLDHPFTRYAFLSALEDSGSVSAEAGWQPYHLSLRDETGTIRAVMPLYVKGHSYGEYVFDHGWADAFERAGGRYYPKLQGSIPFTPVTGARLLSQDRAAFAPAAAEALKGVSTKLGVSSVHLTFMQEGEAEMFKTKGFLHRNDQQFHWQNDEYATFDDFLQTLASRKRKQIRKERKRALADGLSVKWYSGSDLTEERWDDFFAFYMDTGARKWGTPYLNREAFSLMGARMANDIILMLVENAEGEVLAGALNFKGAETLYGRYWGAHVHIDSLHFETCYYQAIDYAIAHGLKTVEAGAQGQHKLARGYVPTLTHSVHWITDPGFRAAVSRFLDQERRQVAADANWLNEHHTPFKKDV